MLDVLLTGSRAVPALGRGRTSTSTTTKVTVPVGTGGPVRRAGVLSDDGGAVRESVETDNCAPRRSR